MNLIQRAICCTRELYLESLDVPYVNILGPIVSSPFWAPQWKKCMSESWDEKFQPRTLCPSQLCLGSSRAPVKAKSMAASLRNLPETWLALIPRFSFFPWGINVGSYLTSDPAAPIALQAQFLSPPANTTPSPNTHSHWLWSSIAGARSLKCRPSRLSITFTVFLSLCAF